MSESGLFASDRKPFRLAQAKSNCVRRGSFTKLGVRGVFHETYRRPSPTRAWTRGLEGSPGPCTATHPPPHRGFSLCSFSRQPASLLSPLTARMPVPRLPTSCILRSQASRGDVTGGSHPPLANECPVPGGSLASRTCTCLHSRVLPCVTWAPCALFTLPRSRSGRGLCLAVGETGLPQAEGRIHS